MRASLLLPSLALAGALLLTGSRAVAQVDSTNQAKPELNALPPDRPALDPTPLPPVSPTAPATPRAVPTPSAPPGTFQPARPAQPSAVPPPAVRPVPTDAGVATPAPAPAPGPAKWFVTGNPDLGFGNNGDYSFFSVGLAALFGYRFTDRLAAGPGLTYQYSLLNGTGFSNVGARVFGQFLISDYIFAHVEYEKLSAKLLDYDKSVATRTLVTYRTTVSSLFAGLGYRQQLGSRTALDFLVLYNFNRLENSFVYGQPEFRFNLLFDLGKSK